MAPYIIHPFPCSSPDLLMIKHLEISCFMDSNIFLKSQMGPHSNFHVIYSLSGNKSNFIVGTVSFKRAMRCLMFQYTRISDMHK